MTLASGLGASIGYATETTYATVVTPDHFHEFDSESLALQPNYFESVGLRANRTFTPAGRVKQTTLDGGGGVVKDLPNKGYGVILNQLHGLTPTVVQQGATAAWLQTHLIGTSVANKSATIQVNKPTSAGGDYPVTYPGAVLTSLGLSLDVGGVVKATETWDTNNELTPDTTPTGPSLAAVSYASGISGRTSVEATVTVNGSAYATCRSVSLTITQPYKVDRFKLGSQVKSRPIPNNFTTVTGTADGEWDSNALYLLYRSGAIVGLVIDCVGPIIASTFHEEFKLNLDAVQVKGPSPQVGGPDVLDQQLAFTAYDGGTNAPLTVTYMSTDVAI